MSTSDCTLPPSSLTDQLQGWGTIAAVVVSLILLTLEIISRRGIAAQELRAQARRLQVGEVIRDRGEARKTGDATVLDTDFSVYIHNASDEALNDLEVLVTISPAYVTVGEYSSMHRLGRLGGQGNTREHFLFGILHKDPAASGLMDHTVSAVVSFTDSAGNRWRREADHSLTLIKRARGGLSLVPGTLRS